MIKLLAAKVKDLKIENSRLSQQNKILNLKSLTSNKFELELVREKQRTKNLLERIEELKTHVIKFFTDQMESDQANVKIMKELRE